MTRDEFVRKLMDRCGVTRAVAKGLLDAVFDADSGIIARELAKGNEVRFSGFGIFSSRVLGYRNARHPGTGEAMIAQPKRVPTFAAGATLRGKLARKTPKLAAPAPSAPAETEPETPETASA